MRNSSAGNYRCGSRPAPVLRVITIAADTPHQPTKPPEKTASNADLIRKVAGIIKAKSEKPRPTEIVKILKEEGVAMASAQISTTLKAADYRPLRNRRNGKKAADGTVAKQAVGASRSSHVSMDDLLTAKKKAGHSAALTRRSRRCRL